MSWWLAPSYKWLYYIHRCTVIASKICVQIHSQHFVWFQKCEPTSEPILWSVQCLDKKLGRAQNEPEKACRLHFLGLVGLSVFSVFCCACFGVMSSYCGVDVFCLVFSCSFSVAGFVCFFVCFFSPLWSNYRQCSWGVVAKIEFMATQNNREQKQAWLPRLVLSHLPLSGPCYSSENNSPRMSAKWFERSPEQNFKEVITSRSQAYPNLEERRFSSNIIQNNWGIKTLVAQRMKVVGDFALSRNKNPYLMRHSTPTIIDTVNLWRSAMFIVIKTTCHQESEDMRNAIKSEDIWFID